MGIFIITFLVAFAIWAIILTVERNWDDLEMILLSFFLTFVIAFAMSLLVGLITHVCIEDTPTHERIASDTPIYALTDGSEVEGHAYFLGSCYIKDNLVYTYVVKEGDRYAVRKVDAEDSYIVYTNDAPHIEEIEKLIDRPGLAWWYGELHDTIYVLYVPEGSITAIDSYNIDLK